MNKVFLFLLACTFAMLTTSCGGGSSSDKARIAELEQQIKDLKNSNNQTYEGTNNNNAVPETSANTDDQLGAGTYTFTDEGGNLFTLVLNEDMTATIAVNNETMYGSWNDTTYDLPFAQFSDKMPEIIFPGGKERSQFLGITDGYIYYRWEFKSKNPQKRLPIKKTN